MALLPQFFLNSSSTKLYHQNDQHKILIRFSCPRRKIYTGRFFMSILFINSGFGTSGILNLVFYPLKLVFYSDNISSVSKGCPTFKQCDANLGMNVSNLTIPHHFHESFYYNSYYFGATNNSYYFFHQTQKNNVD